MFAFTFLGRFYDKIYEFEFCYNKIGRFFTLMLDLMDLKLTDGQSWSKIVKDKVNY